MTMSTTSPATTPKTYPCPRCKKPASWSDNPYRPFCSERCKMIDLGAWADESYRVASQDDPFSDELSAK